MASKKGGGKSQILWIGAIAGLLILAWLTLSDGAGYGGAVGDKSTDKPNAGQNQVKSTPATKNKSSVGGASTNANSTNSNFNLSAKEGGELGGSYLLKNISISKSSNYESANIFVKSIGSTAAFPKYSGTITGNTISIILFDTKNWDIDASAPSYDAENPLTVNGKIIKTIQWVVSGEDSLIIKINLKSQAAFSAVALNNPLTLEIRVAI